MITIISAFELTCQGCGRVEVRRWAKVPDIRGFVRALGWWCADTSELIDNKVGWRVRCPDCGEPTEANVPPSACRSCGAPVIWAKTSTGKMMPVDVAATKDGNIVLVKTRESTSAMVATNPENYPERALHKSHFATCPNAASHRKPKEGT